MLSQINYKRLNIEDYKNKFLYLLDQFEGSRTADEQSNWVVKINQHRFTFETNQNYIRLKYFQNLNDEFFQEEHTFFNHIEPDYLSLVSNYYLHILHSPFRRLLEERWGKQLFRLAKVKIKTTSIDVLDELKRENLLISQYQQMLGKATFTLQGKQHNDASLAPFLGSINRETRKMAYEAKSEYFKQNQQEFDHLLDQLVKTRTTIARKLGYSSFTPLGYDRMSRTSFSPKDLQHYRQQVRVYGIPFVSSLHKKQALRIGVDKLRYYDEEFKFPDGLSVMIDETEKILENFKIMFQSISPDTFGFFDQLSSNEMYDLESRDGKMRGAYATFLGEIQSPFIFANFNRSSNDIRVFTHEAGHAFQFYMSRHWNVPEYLLPYDSAELFSFAMERLTLPWMDKFFGEDVNRYQFELLTTAFHYMPFACAIDEFEHYLYESPQASHEERRLKWKELEQVYLPKRDYDGNQFLENGGGFYEVAHMFTTPFYFMDYELAHFCSVQLWDQSRKNPKSAWDSFLEMCHNGGSKPFLSLLSEAGITSPFEGNSLKQVLRSLEDWIDEHERIYNKRG